MSFKVLATITMLLAFGVWLSQNNPDGKAYETYQDRLLLDAARKASEQGSATNLKIIKKLIESTN